MRTDQRNRIINLLCVKLFCSKIEQELTEIFKFWPKSTKKLGSSCSHAMLLPIKRDWTRALRFAFLLQTNAPLFAHFGVEIMTNNPKCCSPPNLHLARLSLKSS
jgi:hypothetical protein